MSTVMHLAPMFVHVDVCPPAPVDCAGTHYQGPGHWPEPCEAGPSDWDVPWWGFEWQLAPDCETDLTWRGCSKGYAEEPHPFEGPDYL